MGNMRAGFKDAVSGMAPLLLQGCRRSREMTTGIRVSSPYPTGPSEPKARTRDLLSLTDSHCPHQQPLSEGWQTLTKDAAGPHPGVAQGAGELPRPGNRRVPSGATAGAWSRPGPA